MSYFNPTQVYGELKKESECEGVDNVTTNKRQIKVRECGEASLIPDRVKCTIIVTNVKVSTPYFSLIWCWEKFLKSPNQYSIAT